MTRKTTLASALMGLSVAAAFGAPALADDTATEVVIHGQRSAKASSPKTTAALKDMPQTIAVIPNAVFEQQGARNLTDVLSNTPGITFNAGENGFATGLSNFSLRGFDTSGSIFIDGARDSGAYSRDAFNIEQVEVYKGPTADNGRGTAGGFVNLVSKTAKSANFQNYSIGYGFDEYGTDARVRATADLNQKVGDTSAWRLNLLVEHGGVAGREEARVSTFGIAPTYTFGIGTDKRFTLSAQHVSQDDRPDFGVPAALFKGTINYDSNLNGDKLRDKFYGLSTDFDRVTSNVLLARYEQSLGVNTELSTQLRLSATDRKAAFTFPLNYTSATQTYTSERAGYSRDNESISLLGNISTRFTTGSLSHRVSYGIELSQEKADAESFATDQFPAQNVNTPTPHAQGAFNKAPLQTSTVKVQTIAAYFNDTVELSRDWQLTGGARVESYNVKIDSQDAAGAPITADGIDISKTSFSGRLGIVYKPYAATSFYGSVGVAALPPASFLSTSDISRPGGNAFPGYEAGINSQDAKVQQSVNYEVGVKWVPFKDTLSVTGALFRTERQNVAISGRPNLTDPVELLGYGKQIVQGVELGVSGQLSPKWNVFGGLLYMDSERVHSAALDLGRCRANFGDFGAVDAAACDASHTTNGDELAFTPKVSANVWTSYKVTDRFTIGGGARYVGESFVGRPDDAERIIPNGRAGEVPAYWSINGMAEYALTQRVLARLYIDNITNEFYAQSVNWAARRATPGKARSALLTLNIKM